MFEDEPMVAVMQNENLQFDELAMKDLQIDDGYMPIIPQKTNPIVGIIFPPPEVRNIVDKTATFVARNGPEFESRFQHNEQNNPKFTFLSKDDPHHAYYRHKVQEIQEGKTPAVNRVGAILAELSLGPKPVSQFG